jgi:hypothetical protein
MFYLFISYHVILHVHYIYEVFIFDEEILLTLKYNNINVMDDIRKEVLPYGKHRWLMNRVCWSLWDTETIHKYTVAQYSMWVASIPLYIIRLNV